MNSFQLFFVYFSITNLFISFKLIDAATTFTSSPTNTRAPTIATSIPSKSPSFNLYTWNSSLSIPSISDGYFGVACSVSG